MRGLLAVLFSASVLPSGFASAQPVIENFDRFEMNWSNMRIRYYGESPSDPKQGGYEPAEKDAVSKGLLYALTTVPKIREEKGLKADVPGVAENVTKLSYVFNTVYFSDGRVRTELNSSLAAALDFGMTKFAAESPTAPASEASGIVLELGATKSPFVVQEIKTKAGDSAYAASDIAKDAYKKQLTGRWFYANSPELRDFVGANPIKIAAEVQNGHIVVDKEEWNRARVSNERLLQEAKVAYVLGGSIR